MLIESNVLITYKYVICSMKCRHGTVKSTAATQPHRKCNKLEFTLSKYFMCC